MVIALGSEQGFQPQQGEPFTLTIQSGVGVGVVLWPGVMPAHLGGRRNWGWGWEAPEKLKHKEQECPLADGVSRGNKDSGTGLRLELTSSLVKGQGNGIFRPESGPGQREEKAGLQMEDSPTENMGNSRCQHLLPWQLRWSQLCFP